MTSIRIAIADDHPTIIFAAAELQRYLAQASGQPVDVLDRDAISPEPPALWLGLTQHFPGLAHPPAAASADARFDDAISIATEAANGSICGNNPQRIQNPDRFVLMFAPITRTYSKTFSTNRAMPALPRFERNKLTFPRSIEQNLAFLQAWQAQFVRDGGRPVDSFDFDYHLMWDHYRDPAYIQMARVLHDDLQLLDRIGLDGFNSCQVQRAFFPTGLPMAVLGWTLWDKTRDFETMAHDYFAAAFGPEGEAALAYLTQLSGLFDPEYLRGEKSLGGEQAAAALGRVAGVVDSFLPTIERNIDSGTACWACSWRYLRHHAEIATSLASALRERAQGDPANAQLEWNAHKQRVWQMEDALHPVLDVYLFTRVYDGIFKAGQQS